MSTQDLKGINTPIYEELGYYYDSHSTEEDLMGESLTQSVLIRYLIAVLEWLYREEGWLIVSNLNIYTSRDTSERNIPIVPDVAVFRGVVIPRKEQRRWKSWRVESPDRPAPNVVFEISSEETWQADVSLNQKPTRYAMLGVREYFAYDPNEPQVWLHSGGVRLRGWRQEPAGWRELQPDTRGWLWSEELSSWLAPDDDLLRLYTQNGQLRLTRAEAEQAAHLTEQAARLLAEQRAAKFQAEQERLRAWLQQQGLNPDDLK